MIQSKAGTFSRLRRWTVLGPGFAMALGCAPPDGLDLDAEDEGEEAEEEAEDAEAWQEGADALGSASDPQAEEAPCDAFHWTTQTLSINPDQEITTATALTGIGKYRLTGSTISGSPSDWRLMTSTDSTNWILHGTLSDPDGDGEFRDASSAQFKIKAPSNAFPGDTYKVSVRGERKYLTNVWSCVREIWATVPMPTCNAGQNPCPYIGGYDGANCHVGTPPANTTAFIYANNFYYTPVPPVISPNQCPLAGSWFDGANCYVTAIPPQTKPFLWSNMWYVVPVCRP